eukprot:CAMPEP_0182457032 /NCGR_PEP_ID=MMETSP1319-20130603/2709_1 /TAXON_ID=172717 /ORGANISM="Bolidomonas pacifica, Strain RCC208" /LENGTH=158 /DNA_ID=CAMNT_0024655411 /DNA_START=158 /DNA_END=630 /DNA_ORIENTATION=-
MPTPSGAVVSSDHADPSLCVSDISGATTTATAMAPKMITAEEVKEHNGEGEDGSFWCCVDGFVVDATSFLDSHPGGLRKLLSSDSAEVGHTGQPFGFSFSRGRNAHFPDTGRRFRAGITRYMAGQGGGGGDAASGFLPAATIPFPSHGELIVLGKLQA